MSGISGLFSNNYGATPETLELTMPPTVGDLCVTAQRQSDGKIIWDSAWIGKPNVKYPPLAFSPVSASFIVLAQNPGLRSTTALNTLLAVGHDYVDVVAAPLAGRTAAAWSHSPAQLSDIIAPWQYLTGSSQGGLPVGIATVGSTTYLYIIGGLFYNAGFGNGYPSVGYMATINPDGTVTNWRAIPLPPGPVFQSSPGISNGSIASVTIGGTTFIYWIGPDGSNVYWSSLNPDGTIFAWTSFAGPGAGSIAAGDRARLFVDNSPSGVLAPQLFLVISNATTFSMYSWPINSNGTAGTRVGGSVILPTFVKYPAMFTQPNPSGGLWIHLLGGQNTSNVDQNLWQFITATTAANYTTTNLGSKLPVAGSMGAAAIAYERGNTYIYWMPSKAGTGGGVPTSQQILYSCRLAWKQPDGTLPAPSGALAGWSSGAPNSPLQSGAMGTGGSVVTNPNGTETITFQYGGPGDNPTDLPAAGDVIIFQARVTDYASGTPSPISNVGALIFGDPPSIGSFLVQPLNNGNPLITFAFVSGNGGLAQKSWRVTITDANGNVLSDSGVQVGDVDSWQFPPNPPLVSGNTYQITVTVTSLDQPYPESTNSTQAVVSYTPTLTPPAAPTGFSAVGDSTNAWVAFAWTNQANTVLNRLYYRPHDPTDTTPWTLLKNITAGTGAQSIDLMDEIALNTAYDFAVSACDVNNAESAKTKANNVYIAPPSAAAAAGGWNLSLHLAGIGTKSAANRLTLLPYPGGTWQRTPDTQAIQVFGQAATKARNGMAIPWTYDVSAAFLLPGKKQALEAFLLLAQQTGAPIYVRDMVGNIMVATVSTRTYDFVMGDTATAGNTQLSERASNLSFVEVGYNYTP